MNIDIYLHVRRKSVLHTVSNKLRMYKYSHRSRVINSDQNRRHMQSSLKVHDIKRAPYLWKTIL